MITSVENLISSWWVSTLSCLPFLSFDSRQFRDTSFEGTLKSLPLSGFLRLQGCHVTCRQLFMWFGLFSSRSFFLRSRCSRHFFLWLWLPCGICSLAFLWARSADFSLSVSRYWRGFSHYFSLVGEKCFDSVLVKTWVIIIDPFIIDFTPARKVNQVHPHIAETTFKIRMSKLLTLVRNDPRPNILLCKAGPRRYIAKCLLLRIEAD